MSWYALNVIPRQETFVLNALRDAHLIGYAPMHITEARFAKRKTTRSRPLIPGYVFAMLADDYDVQSALAIRGVLAAKIRLRAIEVGALVLEDACHAFDETWTPPRPKGRRYNPRFKSGELVRVREGHHLERQVGLVMKTKGHNRIRILLTIFGRDMEVEMEAKSLEPAQHVDGRLAA